MVKETLTEDSKNKPQVIVGGNNSDAFGERLKLLIGNESQRSFAQKIDVSEGTLRAWINGKSEPNVSALISLANERNVSIDWLVTGKGPMLPGATDRPPSLEDFYDEVDRSDVRLGHSEEARRARMGIKEAHPKADADDYYHLPLYDVRASAGHGALNHSEPIVCMLAFRKEWIRSEIGVSPDQLCLIYSTGESMEPTIYSKDVLLIDKSVNEIAIEGIYVLMLDGTLMIKRCQRLPGRRIKVISDNSAYEHFILEDDKMRTPEQHIVGQVVWAGRKFR